MEKKEKKEADVPFVRGNGRVICAKLFECNVSGVPTRDNSLCGGPVRTFGPCQVMEGLEALINAKERSRLVLVLDNGREIGIMPILKEDALAFEEAGDLSGKSILPSGNWDIAVDVWPR